MDTGERVARISAIGPLGSENIIIKLCAEEIKHKIYIFKS